jgi:hypothetical protein
MNWRCGLSFASVKPWVQTSVPPKRKKKILYLRENISICRDSGKKTTSAFLPMGQFLSISW